MTTLAPPLLRLIDALKRLPGVGPKSAQRMAFHLLRAERGEVQELAEAALGVKDQLHLCTRCHNITDSEPCAICASPNRNPGLICVVEEPHNVMAVENSRQFNGLYHVLQGSISPLRGVGPEQLRIRSLLERLRESGADGRPLIEEVILATNANAEGEATALYLARLLKPLGVRVSRIATGIPVGSEIEYADEVTLGQALQGRREF